MVATSMLYPYGSAFHYARSAGPPWLSRGWIEDVVQQASGSSVYSPEAYRQVLGVFIEPYEQEWVAACLAYPANQKAEADRLDDLVAAAPRAVRRWMERKANLADGTRPGLPLVSTQKVHKELQSHSPCALIIPRAERGKEWDPWKVLSVWLHRNLASQSHTQIAARLDIPEGSVGRQINQHRIFLRQSEEYQTLAVQLVQACLR